MTATPNGATAPAAPPPATASADASRRAAEHWQAGRFRIDLTAPQVMAIVNVTPDSFSDGGAHDRPDAAIAHCEAMLAEGATMLDIGGESTRPGARKPSPDEELARVLPVVQAAVRMGVPVSVDTSEPRVIAAVLDAGADIVNDVRALGVPGALDAVLAHPRVGVCLMHMQGEPDTMQRDPRYAGDVVAEVIGWLRERAGRVQQRGIAAGRICLDPGFGFGKTPAHNAALTRRLPELVALGYPVLAGWSRKSTLGVLTGRPPGERLAASVAAALASVAGGARLLRVHDVAATVDALRVWSALAPVPDGPPMSAAA